MAVAQRATPPTSNVTISPCAKVLDVSSVRPFRSQKMCTSSNGISIWTIPSTTLSSLTVHCDDGCVAVEYHVMREFFRLSNSELLAVWQSPAWSADTKSPHSPPHFETSRYRAVCAASPYESARVGSSCGLRPPATRENRLSGKLESYQNR